MVPRSRQASMLIGVLASVASLLFLGACTRTDDEPTVAPVLTTTTVPDPCADGDNCAPEECTVSLSSTPWRLFSIDPDPATWRIAATIEGTASTQCGIANSLARIALRGSLDGEEVDLFGDREGTTGYQLLGPLHRQITVVVRCDDALPSTPMVGRAWLDDLPIGRWEETIPLDQSDCSSNSPDQMVAQCNLEVSGIVAEDENPDDAIEPPARIFVEPVGDTCPRLDGHTEQVYFAQIAVTDEAGGVWQYSDAQFGELGLPLDPSTPAFADFGYRFCGPNAFLDLDVTVSAAFAGVTFDEQTLQVTDVPCTVGDPDGTGTETSG